MLQHLDRTFGSLRMWSSTDKVKTKRLLEIHILQMLTNTMFSNHIESCLLSQTKILIVVWIQMSRFSKKLEPRSVHGRLHSPPLHSQFLCLQCNQDQQLVTWVHISTTILECVFLVKPLFTNLALNVYFCVVLLTSTNQSVVWCCTVFISCIRCRIELEYFSDIFYSLFLPISDPSSQSTFYEFC